MLLLFYFFYLPRNTDFRHLFMVHNVLLSSASALLLGLMLEEVRLPFVLVRARRHHHGKLTQNICPTARPHHLETRLLLRYLLSSQLDSCKFLN